MCLCCSAIDGVARCSGPKWDRFMEVADKVFEHGITWEKIAVLFYVAGKLAVKVGLVPLMPFVSQIFEDVFAVKWSRRTVSDIRSDLSHNENVLTNTCTRVVVFVELSFCCLLNCRVYQYLWQQPKDSSSQTEVGMYLLW